jgi:hypothetical protein
MSLSVGTVVHNSCYTTVLMCLWVREALIGVTCPDDNSSFCETSVHFCKAAHKNVIPEMRDAYQAVSQNRRKLMVV